MFASNSSISNISVTDLRSFMDSHKEHDFSLIDVREPEEYSQEHMPGAHLIPLMDIVAGKTVPEHAETTFFICRSGSRSRMAAHAMASRGGLNKIYNVAGGMLAFNGRSLPDFPNLKVFDGSEDLRSLLERAIDLEKGAERLYGAVLERFKGSDLEKLVQKLEEAEEGHARALYSMLKKVVGDEPLTPFDKLYDGMKGLFLENGEPLVTMLTWVSDPATDAPSVLEVALDLELKAYDLYRSLADKADDPEMKGAFLDIATQERRHARTVARALAKHAA